MWDYFVAFIDALIVHIVLLAILLFGVNLPKSSSPIPITPEKSVVVDDSAVLAEMERLKREEEFQKAGQRAQQYALEQKKTEYEQFVTKEQTYLETLRQQQQQQWQELEALRQGRLAEEKTLEQLRRDKTELLE